jgi:hypothetical protein
MYHGQAFETFELDKKRKFEARVCSAGPLKRQFSPGSHAPVMMNGYIWRGSSSILKLVLRSIMASTSLPLRTLVRCVLEYDILELS